MEYTLVFSQFGNFGIAVLAFILCLSVIVFVHEFGHYFIGKVCGIRAEVFSVGFGPVLLSLDDKDGTKWQIAALPLGGYVKFLGDKSPASNPSLNMQDWQAGTDNKNDVYKRASMHGAPLWARFLTVVAGPAFNFLFSGIIFFLIYMNQGVTKLPLTVQTVYDTPLKR